MNFLGFISIPMHMNVFIEGLLNPVTYQDCDLCLTSLDLSLLIWKVGVLPHVAGLLRINWHSTYELLSGSHVKKNKTQVSPFPTLKALSTLLRTFFFTEPQNSQVRLGEPHLPGAHLSRQMLGLAHPVSLEYSARPGLPPLPLLPSA